MRIIKKSLLEKAHWPWPKMDLKEVCQRAFDNDFYMPNIGYIKIDRNNGWRAELGEAANSKRLWINSLISAHVLLKVGRKEGVDKYLKLAAELVLSYLHCYDMKDGVCIDAWEDEHAVSNRLFVLTAFLDDSSRYLEDDETVSQAELLYHAERHARWLADDRNYVKNNHGVMMDLALAQFGLFIKLVDQSEARRYIEIALNRLEMMLDFTFDSDGCCTENSTSYHFVNYSLFSAIERFIRKNNLSNSTTKWTDILSKALKVGNLFMRPDGTIPIIGDSEQRIGTFFPYQKQNQSEIGIGYYPGAGFFVAKSPEFQLTLRAGGSSFSHRHLDDLSITLWVRGNDFIVDAGLYNYNIQDKIRRWFTSTRAHSGFYLESIGDVRFSSYTSPSDMSVFLEIENNNSQFNISAAHFLSKEAVVKREIFHKNSSILIEDYFSSNILQKWRFVLILHPDVNVVNCSVDGVSLENKSDKINFKILNKNINQCLIEDSWYSPRFMEKIPTKSIVIKGTDPSFCLRTEISW